MMAIRNGAARAAAAQELGGAPDEVQSDRVRAAEVRIASGARVLLAVVADGSGPAGGEAADRVVEQVFQLVQASRPRELGAALQRGLEIADQGLRRGGGTEGGRTQVAATAAVIWRNQLAFAHCGNSRALHISQGRATELTLVGSHRLGGPSAPRIDAGSLQLRRGDRVVLASDGLMSINPPADSPYVSLSEIRQHASELPPREASRHLVSLALGRDVADNVSVAVLAAPGRAETRKRFPWALAGLAASLLVVIGATAITLLNEPAPPTTDYGFAVLIEGRIAAGAPGTSQEFVANLSTLAGGWSLTAATDAKLGLQSTFNEGSEVSEASLFVGQSTALELTAIDPRRADGQTPRQTEPLGTELTLTAGRVLLLREAGSWRYGVRAQDQIASLIGAGRGVMGVALAGDELVLACIAGSCRHSEDGDGRLLLQSGEMVSVIGNEIGPVVNISSSGLATWDQLCGGCVSEIAFAAGTRAAQP